ncbi:MAG: hypothetical protein U0163_09235 [Gemmatimonadaceae bacterium]
MRCPPLPITVVSILLLLSGQTSRAQDVRSGNPILTGWYADPEAHVFEGHWIFPAHFGAVR